ncbi:MAG: hypothetical protein H0V43_06415, partial [Gemmatimonadales bacterium]|nr:hypothetical protein [Gemmatimonadales bacterium]
MARPAADADSTGWLVDGGAMGELIRSMDWSRTPLGPIEAWPQSLRTAVGLCLASNFPICLAWGPQHVQLYNDGYQVVCGSAHPRTMGQDFTEAWASAWPSIGAAFERARAGETSYLENVRMFLERNGYMEETFFTFSFSPIRDETGSVGGLFHPVTETTGAMLAQRRTRALRDLAARAGDAKSVDAAFAVAAEVLSGYELDLPFVLMYAFANASAARLVGSTGVAPGASAAPALVDLGEPGAVWPLTEVKRSGDVIEVTGVAHVLGASARGPYPEPPKTALLLPVLPPGAERPAGVIVAGMSPRLPLDDTYRGFCEQVAAAVSSAVASARAHEEERRRAEMLAELDRAKTAFFSNV